MDSEQRCIGKRAAGLVGRPLTSSHKFAKNPDDFAGELKFKSVKVYRVVHAIPPAAAFVNGIPPTNPTWYHPFYLGNHDMDGALIKDNDPYLYWLLPILPQNGNDPDTEDLRTFAACTPGDSQWVRAPRVRKEMGRAAIRICQATHPCQTPAPVPGNAPAK